jgi:outer membrane protein TolC
VLNDVWDKFHALLVLQSQRAVKAEALSQSRAQRDIARTERELGMIREVDLLDVELSVSNQEIDLQSTDAALLDAVYALKKSVGLEPGQDIALEGSIDASYAGITIGRATEDFVAIAQAGNLDLQSAGYRVTQLETQLAMARNQYLPQVSANLSLSLSGNDFPLQTPAFTLGLDVSFPEPVAPVKASASGGATGASSSSRSASLTVDPFQSITAGLDQADARLQLEEAQAALRALTRDLRFQVGQLIATYRQHAARIELERQARGLLQRKLAILAQQVASGSATRMDYLKQQTDAADQEVRLLSDILTLFRDERAIERLLGVEPGDLVRLAGGGNE